MDPFMKRNVLPIVDSKQFLEEGRKEFQKCMGDNKRYEVSRQEFDFIKTIGVGSFGRVYLAKHLVENKYYAIKVVEKEVALRRNQMKAVLNEKMVLQSLNHPFTVYLEFAFEDKLYIFLGQPFVSGGELFVHLRRMRKYEESLSRFYAGQVVLAIEYLHHCGLVYRDLKPENLLLDKYGFLKIADFGTCKLLNGTRLYNFCGTPEYVAPEVVLGRAYSRSVDWWSFGVLLFEMNAGYTPFYARSEVKVYKKCVNCDYTLPNRFSQDLKHLITNLLQVDVTKRYGNLKNGVDDIKVHLWFQETDWDSLLNKNVEPPFVPIVKSDDDTCNFYEYDEVKLLTCSHEGYCQVLQDTSF